MSYIKWILANETMMYRSRQVHFIFLKLAVVSHSLTKHIFYLWCIADTTGNIDCDNLIYRGSWWDSRVRRSASTGDTCKPAPTTGLRIERDGDKGAAGIVLSGRTPAHRLFTGANENTEADFARLQSWVSAGHSNWWSGAGASKDWKRKLERSRIS